MTINSGLCIFFLAILDLSAPPLFPRPSQMAGKLIGISGRTWKKTANRVGG